MKNSTRCCLIISLFALALGAAPRALAQSPDPATTGVHLVTREEYNLGDLAFTPTGWPQAVELRGSVHYPSDLSGPTYPLIIFLHGRHSVCANGVSFGAFQWPCPIGQTPIPSFAGYDYIAEVLASHGYVVVSISANGINATDGLAAGAEGGALARAELIQKHLDLWNGFNTVGGAPFGNKFVGRLNMQRVGVMGHSRGGEGAVRHFQLNQSLGSPYGIRAVFALAPIDFNREIINNVPLAVLLPYCDGDVSDLEGARYYDDARYNVPGDPTNKHTILVLGANHNFFNSIWTPALFLPAGDDWPTLLGDPHCNVLSVDHRLTHTQQRATGLVYIAAFLRVYVGGQGQFLPLLTAGASPPASALTTQIFPAFHPADLPVERRDVNRLLDATNLTTSTIGGAVTQSGLTPFSLCGGPAPQPPQCLSGSTSRQPHTTPGIFGLLTPGASQLTTGWDNTAATLTHDIPSGQHNVSAYQALQFRASVNFQDVRNTAGVSKDFRVMLTDGNGVSVTVRVSDSSRALFFPPGTLSVLPKVVLNTVRIPLSSFAGVNLADLRTIQFKFDQNVTGALLVTDILFASTGASSVPAAAPDLCVKADGGSGSVAFNSQTGDYTFCCGGPTVSGKGVITTQGGLLVLTDLSGTRRVLIKVDRSTGTATATLQSPPGRVFCSFADRNVFNSACTCGSN
ncbi:MAG TPA: hypothetical protein VJH03_00940 [Blastocatellia bacterium]|nr:hypothetical protein [Blastocatellia bacterium]